MKLKPPTLLRSRKARGLIAAAVAIGGFATLTIAQTTPAWADPTEGLVAVGSDTVQDVYNQFAIDFGANNLASYNAVNPQSAVAGENITPVEISQNGTNTNPNTATNCSFTRPNGSGGGLAALRESLNPGSTIGGIHGTAAAPQQFCVDIARSSTSPSGDGHVDPTNGAIVFVPFAEDAVAGSTGPAAGSGFSTTPYNYSYQYTFTSGTTTQTATNTISVTPTATNITHADAFTLVDLINLYHYCDPVTEGGVTYWPFGSAQAEPAGAQQIDLYVPQLNSGTRNFWASTLGFDKTALNSCVHDKLTGADPFANVTVSGNAAPVPVEEHNGTPLASDPDGFAPFSIAQWIAQSNGIDDRRHTAVVHNLANCTGITTTTVGGVTTASGNCGTATVPYSTVLGKLKLNSAFPVNRYVYSVASWARVNNTNDALYALLNDNSGANFLCNEQSAISQYGFATIPNATLTESCGDVNAANRADD